MPTIETRAGDISRKLKERGVANDETVFVSYQRTEDRRLLREAIEQLQQDAEKAGITDQDIMDLLEIDEGEFENIFVQLPAK